MKILFLLDNYWPHVGGAENAFRSLCEGMAARGHSVTVVAHRPRNVSGTQTLNGVNIVRLPCLNSRYVFTFVALLWVVLKRPRASVINTTTFNAAPAAWLAGYLRRIPVVMTINETWLGNWHAYTDFSRHKAALHELLERAVFSFRYDAYVAISKATATRVAAVIPRSRARLQTIYYGFDSSPWKGVSREKALREKLGLTGRFVVLGFGRPGASKGFQWLVDAIPAVRSKIPNVAVVLILSEDSQYARELLELKRRARGGALFLSPRPFSELPVYIKSADCVVVPSLAEGFGYTTLEAVAAGVPVVATRVGSIPEVIGGQHRLISPRDVDELAAALLSIKDGRADTAPERSFPWSKTLEQYEALYRRLSMTAYSDVSFEATQAPQRAS